MKKENISDAVGALSNDIIEDAAAVRNTRSARPYAKIAKFAALAAVFALCIVGVRYMPSLIPPDPVGTEPPIISPDEHPDMYSESPTDVPTETPIEAPTEAPTGTPADSIPLDTTEETSTSDTVPEELQSHETEIETEKNGIGGSRECVHTVYDRSYHQIDGYLIEYVVRIYGQEAYDNWGVERRKEINPAPDESFDYCSNFTIVDYVEDFNIPREVFEALNDNYLSCRYDYNLDAIYAGKDVAEAYYRGDRSQVVLERNFLRNIKGQLELYVENQDAEAIPNWIKEKNSTEWGFSEATRSHIEIPGYGYSDEFRGGYSQYSFKEFIDYFNIPRDVVEEIYLQCQNPALEGELNIDALYAAEFDEEYFRTTSPLEIDMQFFTYEGNN